MPIPSRPDDDFQRLAESPPPGMLREFWDFLRENRAWWLTPIIVVLLAISVLVILGATGAAPLIYTLF
jgi:Family of unknown function (DUF5989)